MFNGNGNAIEQNNYFDLWNITIHIMIKACNHLTF